MASNGKNETSGAPLVTICLPTIGRTQFWPALRSAIESQTLKDFEILVLDNACPDDARHKLAEWAREEPRLRVLPIDERVPMFANFNRGHRNARGKYFCNFNDDDVYLPDFLERLVGFLEKEPGVAFAGSNFDFIDEHDKITEKRRWVPRTEVCAGRQYIKTLMTRGRNHIAMPGVVYRCDAMDSRGFDEEIGCYYGDFVVLMRMAERFDVGLLDDTLVRIRRHSNQASLLLDHGEGFAIRATVLRGYCAEFRARWPQDQAFARLLDKACARSTRVGSLWGWLTARDRATAHQCLDMLGDSTVDTVLNQALRRIDVLGIDAEIRRTLVAPIVRRVGNALRV